MRRALLAIFVVCLLLAPGVAHASASYTATRGPELRVGTSLTLEQTAYRFWGARLEAACPNGSLRFRRVPPAWGGVTDEDMGGSWGDCHPWVRTGRDRAPQQVCDTAMHEAGHEVGLPDFPDTGGLMDNTRLIIGSRAIIHLANGRTVFRESWNVVAVCRHWTG